MTRQRSPRTRLWYSAQNAKPTSNHEEAADKPKMKTVLEDNWSVLFKMSRVRKTEKLFQTTAEQT